MDPGETIGLAYYDDYTRNYNIRQESHAVDARMMVEGWDYRYEPDWGVVENYNSSGHLSKAGKHTIMVLGVFHFVHGFQMVAPQARLAYVDEATALIGDDAKELHRNGRDAIAALAHAIAFSRSKS